MSSREHDFAQLLAESDIRHYHLYGEGVSAGEPMYGEGAPKHRHRRSARARREQRSRAEIRTIDRLLRGACAMNHRGCKLGTLTQSFVETLVANQATRLHGKFGGDRSNQPQHMPLCCHYLQGRCTFGSSCRFSHEAPGGCANNFDQEGDAFNDHDNDNTSDSGYDNGYSDGHHGSFDGSDTGDQDDNDHGSNNVSNGDGYNTLDNDLDQQPGTMSNNQHGNDYVAHILQTLAALDDDGKAKAIEQLPPNLYYDVMRMFSTTDKTLINVYDDAPQHKATHVIGHSSICDNNNDDDQLECEREQCEDAAISQNSATDGDDIDDIIEILNALGQDTLAQEQVFSQLPDYLQHEVQGRLEQYADDHAGRELPKDDDDDHKGAQSESNYAQYGKIQHGEVQHNDADHGDVQHEQIPESLQADVAKRKLEQEAS